jgi:hypothetical protein
VLELQATRYDRAHCGDWGENDDASTGRSDGDEDKARHYGLPPLSCGQIYTEK